MAWTCQIQSPHQQALAPRTAQSYRCLQDVITAPAWSHSTIPMPTGEANKHHLKQHLLLVITCWKKCSSIVRTVNKLSHLQKKSGMSQKSRESDSSSSSIFAGGFLWLLTRIQGGQSPWPSEGIPQVININQHGHGAENRAMPMGFELMLETKGHGRTGTWRMWKNPDSPHNWIELAYKLFDPSTDGVPSNHTN